MHGSKVKVANLAPLGVMGHLGSTKSALVGVGHDVWGVLKQDSEVLEGPLGELSGEDIESRCPVLFLTRTSNCYAVIMRLTSDMP